MLCFTCNKAMLCLRQARFLIIQQKYVEAVEAGHMSLALRTLRKELTPLKINEPQLRKLAGTAPITFVHLNLQASLLALWLFTAQGFADDGVSLHLECIAHS